MRLAFLVTLSVFAAGCVSDTPSADVADATPSPSAQGPNAPGNLAPEGEETAPVIEVLELPASITLSQGAMVCAPQTRSHCVAPVGTPAWGMQDWIEGELATLRMVATWTAATPATEQLHGYAGACFGVEEDYTCENFMEFDGTSPLEIDIRDMPGKFNYYYVGLQDTAATEYASASTEQNVALEGEITWRRA